eukprot:scaffold5276_cov134-Cylindrotheca_fusiformis.AAC.15
MTFKRRRRLRQQERMIKYGTRQNLPANGYYRLFPVIHQRRSLHAILFAVAAVAEGFQSIQSGAGGRARGSHWCKMSQQSSRLFSQQTSAVEEIRLAFKAAQTDGIVELSNHGFAPDIDDLVPATLQAVGEKKGHVASVLNGFIGACALMDDRAAATSRVCELLEAFDALEENEGIAPDIVTYSLAFNALSLDPSAVDIAEMALERALKMSKKISGSKRRKALAAARRKKAAPSFAFVENDLKTLLGPDFQVLNETDHFFVISKPSGVSCFHKRTTTSGKIQRAKRNKSPSNSDISLEDALLTCNVPLSTLNPEALGLVHRLDRGTSGCMVLAKTEEMHAKLLAEFFLRRSEKSYTTIVSPAPDQSLPDKGCIELPVGGRPARSEYTVLERYGAKAAMLHFVTYTGRKHQIRVHAADGLSSPVVFDDKYGSSASTDPLFDSLNEENGTKSMICLHASSLSIPRYGIQSEAPIPAWWDPIIESVEYQ